MPYLLMQICLFVCRLCETVTCVHPTQGFNFSGIFCSLHHIVAWHPATQCCSVLTAHPPKITKIVQASKGITPSPPRALKGRGWSNRRIVTFGSMVWLMAISSLMYTLLRAFFLALIFRFLTLSSFSIQMVNNFGDFIRRRIITFAI